MNRVADGMESFARWGLVLVTLAAPWFLGGYRLSDQLWIFGVVVASYGLWWLSNLLRGSEASLVVPWTLMAAALFVGIGVLQLIPVSFAHPSFSQALFSNWLAKIRTGPITIEPAASRIVVVRLGVAFLAALLATQVFQLQRDRRILWILLATNGAALTLFGIAQRLSWNGSLFWTIPLRFGGQPFASYVNRNNAAGYLCLALAAGFGGLAVLGASDASLTALRSRFKKGAIPRIQRDWGTLEIAVLVLTACTLVGVFASFSRGGMLAGILTAGLGILMLWGMLGKRVVLYVAAMLAIPVVGVVWLNFDQTIRQRMGGVATAAGIQGDVRWLHWSDTLRAVPDIPAGSGFGTYRYLNRPYQQHAARGWYYNADNQYVETLIETGPVGLLIIAVCASFLVRTAFRAWNGVGDADLRDVAVVLALTVLSQADLAFTDFGVTMPANMLTLSLIIGTCLGAFPRGERGTAPEVRGAFALILGGLMASLPGTGLAEVSLAARQASFLDQVPNFSHSVESPDAEMISKLISEGEPLLQGRPDNAALHLALADLWIYRLRAEAAAELQAINPSLHPSLAWGTTSPVSFFRQTLAFQRAGDTETLNSLRESPAVVKNLVPAWTHLQQAHAACPYLPKTHFLMGCLGPIMGLEESVILAHFRHDAALSPFDADNLLASGLVLQELKDSQTAMQLWKRALTLDPDATHRIFQVGMRQVNQLVFLNEAIPDSVPVLLKFVEQTELPAAKSAALQRLETILPDQSIALPYENWVRGRVYVLENRLEDAADSFRKAADADPQQISYRLDLVDVLEKLERWNEAFDELTKCQHDDPSYADRLREFTRKQDEQEARERRNRRKQGSGSSVSPTSSPPSSTGNSTTPLPGWNPWVAGELSGSLASSNEPGAGYVCLL